MQSKIFLNLYFYFSKISHFQEIFSGVTYIYLKIIVFFFKKLSLIKVFSTFLNSFFLKGIECLTHSVTMFTFISKLFSILLHLVPLKGQTYFNKPAAQDF